MQQSTKRLPVRKKSNATERKGVAFVRDAVEEANCVFKEIDRASDYGHDAFVLLVDHEEVMPQEIALQIKSGRSFCKKDGCSFTATAAQLNFWARHPFVTLGVVYDPDEQCAWWVDLKEDAKTNRQNVVGKTVNFAKAEWNRFDLTGFESVILPTLLGEAPRISLQQASSWLASENMDTHDLGARVLLSRYRNETSAWTALLDAFLSRGRNSSYSVYRALVRIMGHNDEGCLPYEVPEKDRLSLRSKILAFKKTEIVELLHFVEDSGYERGCAGYGLFAIIPLIREHTSILNEIYESLHLSEELRENAALLLAIKENDLHWWELWLPSKK